MESREEDQQQLFTVIQEESGRKRYQPTLPDGQRCFGHPEYVGTFFEHPENIDLNKFFVVSYRTAKKAHKVAKRWVRILEKHQQDLQSS